MRQHIDFNQHQSSKGLPSSVMAALASLAAMLLVLTCVTVYASWQKNTVIEKIDALPSQIAEQDRHLAKIKENLALMETEKDPDALARAEANYEKYVALNNVLSTRKGKLPFDRVLSALTYHGVEQVYLTKLSLSVQGELIIHGKASSTAQVAELQARLRKLPPINQVRFNHVRVEKAESGAGFIFEISTRRGSEGE